MGKNSFKNASSGIGPTRYFLTSEAITVCDSTRYFWVVVKGNVVAMVALTGVECGSGSPCLGGVLGAMTKSACGHDSGRSRDHMGRLFPGSTRLGLTRSHDQLRLVSQLQAELRQHY